MTSKKDKKFVRIQILRAFAASVVVVFHSIGTSHHYLPAAESRFLSLFRYGDVGVDLFFVISGFIIYNSTHLSEFVPAEFLRHRLIRIVPLYWLATLAFVGLLLLVPSAFNGESFEPVHTLFSLFFVSFATGQAPIIYVGWSLEFEIFFYLAVAFFLRGGEAGWRRLTYVFSLLTVGHCISIMLTTSPMFDFFTNPRIIEFCYGVIIGIIVARRETYAGPMAAAGLATALNIIVDWPRYFLLAGLVSALLVYLVALFDLRQRSVTLIEAVGAKIGDASYSIYLFQVFLISGFCKFAAHFTRSTDLMITSCALFSILFGYFLFVAIERPLLRWARNLVTSRERRTPTTAR